jgi:hypothetical protein
MNRWWVLAVPVLFVAGCGFPAGKVDEAGGKPDELKPVEFHEAMWAAGDKLVSFEMGEAKYAEAAQAVRCEVKLTVQKGKGKARTESVVYDVTLGPPVKVVNNPMP